MILKLLHRVIRKMPFPLLCNAIMFSGFFKSATLFFCYISLWFGEEFYGATHISRIHWFFIKSSVKQKAYLKKNSEKRTLINWKLSGMEFTLENKILYSTKRAFALLIYFSWAFIMCKCIISFSFNINTKTY